MPKTSLVDQRILEPLSSEFNQFASAIHLAGIPHAVITHPAGNRIEVHHRGDAFKAVFAFLPSGRLRAITVEV